MRVRKFVVSAAAVALVVLGSAVAVHASTRAGDTDDKFSTTGAISAKLTGTVSANCGTGSNTVAPLVVCGSIQGLAFALSCTIFNVSGNLPTPAKGLVATLTGSPKIGGTGTGGTCKDNAGGTDTVKTNTTNGKWTLTEGDVDATGETTKEPNTTDKATLTIPKAGITFEESPLLVGCVITVAPTAPAKLTGTFNDVTTIKDSGVVLPLSIKALPGNTSGCPTIGPAKAYGNFVLSKAVHDVS